MSLRDFVEDHNLLKISEEEFLAKYATKFPRPHPFLVKVWGADGIKDDDGLHTLGKSRETERIGPYTEALPVASQQLYPLSKEEVPMTIGRSLSNGIVLNWNETVSRLHCRVTNLGGFTELWNFKPKCGTRLRYEGQSPERLRHNSGSLLASQVEIELGHKGAPDRLLFLPSPKALYHYSHEVLAKILIR